MRVISLLLVLWSFASAYGQDITMKNQWENAPKTLAEAHAELERILPAETLAEIDAMESEKDMIKYHFGLGLNIRNGWGLWRGSALAKHMQELGFTHPDIMSGVILNTFWCKRHGQEFRLKERATAYQKSMEIGQKIQQKAEEEKAKRVEQSKAAIQDMMIPLEFVKQDTPVVWMPIRRSIPVRSMCPFRDGVFVTAYSIRSNRSSNTTSLLTHPNHNRERRRPGRDFCTVGFFFNLQDCKMPRIHVPEVNDVCSTVMAGKRAWFAGLTDGKPILVGVGEQDRVTVPLPLTHEIPDLGLDGQSLLAVYSRTIYRLDNLQWTVVYSGDLLLPRAGMPPQQFGDRVFIRSENREMTELRLQWLTIGEPSSLDVLDRDVGLFEPIVLEDPRNPIGEYREPIHPSYWMETSSYCVTNRSNLWACIGQGSFLLRRSQDGTYAFAVAYDSIQLPGNGSGSEKTEQNVYISAVTALPDDTLLLAGDMGLYRLKGNELIQKLAFTFGRTPNSNDGKARRVRWTPTNVLRFDDQTYVIGGGYGNGVYLLHKGNDNQWKAKSVNTVPPVTW